MSAKNGGSPRDISLQERPDLIIDNDQQPGSTADSADTKRELEVDSYLEAGTDGYCTEEEDSEMPVMKEIQSLAADCRKLRAEK